MEGWGGGRPSQVPGLHEQVSLLLPPASGVPSSWPWGQAVLGGDYSSFSGGVGYPWLGPTTSLSPRLLLCELGTQTPQAWWACPLGCEDMMVTDPGVSSQPRESPSQPRPGLPWPHWGRAQRACGGDGRNVKRRGATSVGHQGGTSISTRRPLRHQRSPGSPGRRHCDISCY